MKTLALAIALALSTLAPAAMADDMTTHHGHHAHARTPHVTATWLLADGGRVTVSRPDDGSAVSSIAAAVKAAQATRPDAKAELLRVRATAGELTVTWTAPRD